MLQENQRNLDRLLAMNDLEPQRAGGMKLQIGRPVKDRVEKEDEQYFMAPLITKEGQPQYVPW